MDKGVESSMKIGKIICSIFAIVLFIFGVGIKLFCSILKAIAVMLKIAL